MDLRRIRHAHARRSGRLTFDRGLSSTLACRADASPLCSRAGSCTATCCMRSCCIALDRRADRGST
jgi:hypothetical protein